MPALGDEFRIAREARGLTLSDVAEKLHIRSVYLNAIEAEDWKAIGAPVYVRGFIRTYARFLALDGESAIAHYNETVPQDRPTATPPPSGDDRPAGPSIWAIVAVVAALLLVAFVGYEWWSYAQGAGARNAASQPPPALSVSSASAAPAASATLASAGVPNGATPGGPPSTAKPRAVAVAATPGSVAGGHALSLRLTERSWLRVTVDGKTVIEGIYPAGTSRTLRGNAADVRAGNGGGVSISVNGHPEAPLGKAGDVVEQRYSL